ncbi:MAG: hypothetical protein CV090_03115 [Nitrospira sp. WS238]|nr:hypothetical protein [Nitrospira sp. WS238]
MVGDNSEFIGVTEVRRSEPHELLIRSTYKMLTTYTFQCYESLGLFVGQLEPIMSVKKIYRFDALIKLKGTTFPGRSDSDRPTLLGK